MKPNTMVLQMCVGKSKGVWCRCNIWIYVTQVEWQEEGWYSPWDWCSHRGESWDWFNHRWKERSQEATEIYLSTDKKNRANYWWFINAFILKLCQFQNQKQGRIKKISLRDVWLMTLWPKSMVSTKDLRFVLRSGGKKDDNWYSRIICNYILFVWVLS